MQSTTTPTPAPTSPAPPALTGPTSASDAPRPASSTEPGPPAVPASPRAALVSLAGSKKFLVVAAAIAVAVAGYLARLAGAEVDQDGLFKNIIVPLIAYVTSQGMADFGKERRG